MSTFFPVIVFGYNRPQHLKQTLDALTKNTLATETDLFIFIDGVKSNCSVQDLQNNKECKIIADSLKWNGKKELFFSDVNKGLANSIKDGVSQVIKEYFAVIVLEDDIVPTERFLEYMNYGLNKYSQEHIVSHISAYIPFTTGADRLDDLFFTRYMSCWGWGTWLDRWENANWDTQNHYDYLKKNDLVNEFNFYGTQKTLFDQIEGNINGKKKTWAINWYTTIFRNKGLVLTPKSSFVKNIGLDDSGENSSIYEATLYDVDVSLSKNLSFQDIPIKESIKAKKYLMKAFKYGRKSNLLQRSKMNFFWIKKRLTT